MNYLDEKNDKSLTEDVELELLKKDFGLDPKDEVSLAAPTEPEKNATIELACQPLAGSLKKELSAVLEKMRQLLADIDAKVQVALSREEALQKKLDAFIKAEIFTDDSRKKALTQGVESYLALLSSIRGELEKDLSFYEPYLADVVPATVTVPVVLGSKDSTNFFELATMSLKVQAKDVLKYLMVSHSRYMYGFDLQEKSLDALSYKLLSLQIQQRRNNMSQA